MWLGLGGGVGVSLPTTSVIVANVAWKPHRSAFMIVSFRAGTGSSTVFEGIMTIASPILEGEFPLSCNPLVYPSTGGVRSDGLQK